MWNGVRSVRPSSERAEIVDPSANVKMPARVLSVDSPTTDSTVVHDPLVSVELEGVRSTGLQPVSGWSSGSGAGRLRLRHGAVLSALRRWFRCWWRTRGMHQLQLHTNRCRYCKLPWSQLYPTDEAPSGRADQDTTARLT